jgi:RimJ/RimL family protein N-acetyltransferase
VLTDRLEMRLPLETDRGRFVELFCDRDFMVFSDGVCSTESAHARFDEMLSNGTELSYAKQPVIELATGEIVGYCGVAWFDFEEQRRLEFGYRFVPEARGRPSSNVVAKLGFTFWKQGTVNCYGVDLYRRVFS